MIFKDRHEAGLKLAAKLEKYRAQPHTVVMGLARGGVVVAHAVAKALQLPLDVIVIRKVGAPGQEELAIGAVDEEGDGFMNEAIIQTLHINPDYVLTEVAKQTNAAKERAALYRKGGKRAEVKGKTVIVVDDGVATGASVRAALRGLKQKGVEKIILAVPVAAPDTLKSLSREVNEAVCLYTPSVFMAVGQFYRKFDQTSDEEVIKLLA
ncbi:MAG TPA: phosphoribosyltransferase family protein [Rhabdochlamydiaceae bacterium]|jgi:putative phosphoribosyl transferase|nr:phosphoribosyltransferase family protein [Rhabdochlamydiaceae bacterium]